MTNPNSDLGVKGMTIAMAIFSIVCLVILGCNLGRFMSSGNSTTTSDSTNSDNGSSDTSGPTSALCSNAFFPAGPAIMRKYRIVYSKGKLGEREYTESFSDFQGDVFQVHTDFGNVKARVTWRCTPDGLLATQYENSVSLTQTGASATIHTVDSNGVTLPPEDRWRPGEKWHAEYHVTEAFTAPDGKQMGTGDGTVSQDGEIVGQDSITVPAGTFSALKVLTKTQMNLTVEMKGVSLPMNFPLETTAWFAKGTGMVKSVTKMGKNDATSELVSSSN